MLRSAPTVCDYTANYRPGVNTTHSLFFVLNTRTQKRRAFSFWWPKSTRTKKCRLVSFVCLFFPLPLLTHACLSTPSLASLSDCHDRKTERRVKTDIPLCLFKDHTQTRERLTGMKPHVLFISKGGRRHTNPILTPAISKQKTPLNGHEGKKKNERRTLWRKQGHSEELPHTHLHIESGQTDEAGWQRGALANVWAGRSVTL